MSVKDFSCGFKVEDTKKLFKSLPKRCAKYRNPVNLCCAIHKDCYGLGKGKNYCDSELCSCIKRIPISRRKCEVPVNKSCTYVRSHKGDYNATTLDTDWDKEIFTSRTRDNLGLGSSKLLLIVSEECYEVPCKELLSCIIIVGLTALLPIRISLPFSDKEEEETPSKSPAKKLMATPKTPSAEGLKGSAESPDLAKQPGSHERSKDSAESPDLTRPAESRERSKRSAESPDKPGSHERSKRSGSHEPAEPPKRESAEKMDRHTGENLHQPFPPPVSPVFHTGDPYFPHPSPGPSHPFEHGSLEPFKQEDYRQREIYEPRLPDVNFFDLPKLEKENKKKETEAKKKNVEMKGKKSPAKVEKKTGKKSAEKQRNRKIAKALALFGKGKKK
ncbi:unnamed protein product [Cylicocyclus nassatus]|uniref:Uncharacterized protein n=1 Tax=Cylicocyclus nassatus TaxID=53992 RepID=A0AA36DIC2_CYLNA|nr:unnamed protein product [Cylicocyclus nassatus]